MKRISKTEIKEMRSQSKKNRIMFAFTLPTVILYTIFFLVTMLIGVYYSFTDWNGGPAQSTEAVGLLIYRHAINEGKFSTSVAESMILFVIVGVVSAFSLRLTSNKQVGE